MAGKRLNPIDASWLLVESADTPMHVGGLAIYELPDGEGREFFERLDADLRDSKEFFPPWNLRLAAPALKSLVPFWREGDVDVEYHLRRLAVPSPGGERQLGQLIARLHSYPLDLRRPPWECEVIEGLEGNRFAIYTKLHHSLIDGIAGMRLLQRSMSTDIAKSRKLKPFWSIGPEKRSKPEEPPPTLTNALAHALDSVWSQVRSAPELIHAFKELLRGGAAEGRPLFAPFDTPALAINGRIGSQRRFATQQFALDRMKSVAKAANCTLNDVVLAICGAALRRFLYETGELPDKPLTAGIPVSVRPADDEGGGNAITFIIATLGTDIAEPVKRLAAISGSTRRAKEHVQSLPRQAMTQYTLLLMAPYTLSLLTGLAGRTRPMFNVTVSNVPGPAETLYYRGARLQAAYPVSLVSHGQALNITCQSYAGTLNFGFTGCRETLPHMQRIAVYTGEALAELETALIAPVKKRRRRTKAAAAA